METVLGSSSATVLPSAPQVIKSSEDVEAVYLDDVTIFCTVKSLTSDFMVTWSTTANISLPSATTVMVDSDKYNSSLTLTSVNLKAMGMYFCSVRSSSASIVVNVTGL